MSWSSRVIISAFAMSKVKVIDKLATVVYNTLAGKNFSIHP